MCIVTMAWASHPRWGLVLAGNRDEHHVRSSAALAPWDDQPGIIAGRDLQSGGTWAGVSDTGRMAVVTNQRGYGLARPDRASRGALVTDMLTGEGAYAAPTLATLDDFNPFTLIAVDRHGARLLTNRPTPEAIDLCPGIIGLSNGPFADPWPKTRQLNAMLADWLARGDDDPAGLFTALRCETLPHDTPSDAEPSPIFIRDAIYGTRCSTIVTIDSKGQGMIAERRYDAEGQQTGETRIAFAWPL
jgi:uncharacterized protein with NRDE domain